MSDTVQSIINAAADEADSLLDGIASPADAKPILLEWLSDNFPQLPEDQRHSAVHGVVSILKREGFFDGSNQGPNWSDSDDPAEAEE